MNKCYLDDEIKANKMGGTCSTHSKYESCIQNFSLKPERIRPFWITKDKIGG